MLRDMGYVAGATGQRVRDERARLGLSQEKLAGLAGITTRTVRRIEAGEETTVGTLAAIAEALGIPFGDLIDDPAAWTRVVIPADWPLLWWLPAFVVVMLAWVQGTMP